MEGAPELTVAALELERGLRLPGSQERRPGVCYQSLTMREQAAYLLLRGTQSLF